MEGKLKYIKILGFTIAACGYIVLSAFRLMHDGAKKRYKLKQFDFDPAKFKRPASEFGPFTRWWWPGNDVTQKELVREFNLFAENHFAGVDRSL